MNDVLLRYSQGLPVLRVEDRGKTWAESSRNGCVCVWWGGGAVVLYWASFLSTMVMNTPQEVGGSCDSRQLTKVGTNQQNRF